LPANAKIENLIAPTATVPSPVPRPPMPVASAPRDPLAGLIASDRRTIAAQKALTEFGFGQIKPTGIVGPDTKAAVEKFERERRLPVTGQLSDRVLREIATVTGRSLD
jgi:peptidoglycan hydrolase-like protein with peptidoglycan-binding domain